MVQEVIANRIIKARIPKRLVQQRASDLIALALHCQITRPCAACVRNATERVLFLSKSQGFRPHSAGFQILGVKPGLNRLAGLRVPPDARNLSARKARHLVIVFGGHQLPKPGRCRPCWGICRRMAA